MRNLILIIMLLGLVLTGCQVVRGSGAVIIEERQTSAFNGVSLNGIGEVTFIQKDEQSVWIEAEDNIMPYITTEVRHDVLIIGIQDGTTIQNTKPIKFTVSAPEITLFDVSGAGEISSETIETNDLSIDVSGSGEIRVSDVSAESLAIRISGSGDVVAQGAVIEQGVYISGSGNYTAPDLVSNDVEIDISGSGEALVWATDYLTVNISGAGKVAYQGEPEVNRSVSGIGVVEQVAER